MLILGIESSCDDTSVALVDCSENGFVVIAEKTASQVEIHAKYGGVVPEIAGRKHAEQIMPVIEAVLEGQEKPDVIAVTAGPGLMTGLLVGTEAAKTLSYLWNIPMVAVNHIEGHIHSVFVTDKAENSQFPISNFKGTLIPEGCQFPAVCLIVSGGHTELILMEDFGKYSLISKTRDDAAGEAFDKVGKLLGLDYPGGPKISKLAAGGNPTAINFPRPMLDSDNFDFSFSGLKTAALYWLKDNDLSVIASSAKQERRNLDGTGTSDEITTSSLHTHHNDSASLEDFCASFEQAITDVLVEKTKRAIKKHNAKTLILGGGVSANQKLRDSLQQIPSYEFLAPSPQYSMDNGAMIAAAAYHHSVKREFTKWNELEVNPNWRVYEL